jgi:plasmid stability protein
MATLNIKNFPDDLYKTIQQRSKQDRRSVAQEVVYLLEQASKQAEPRSILELRGLGRECWDNIDAAAYIDQERAEWE